ncbi:MAG: hypothetical protein AMJ81_13265, partial [Phycisphaerae bacterium SM23_33]
MAFLRRFVDGFVFVSGSRRQLRRRAPEGFAPLAGRLMLLGIAWGLVVVGLWELTFRFTTRARLVGWVVPACVCAAATVFGPYRPGCLSLARTLTGIKPPRWLRLLRWPVFLALTGGLASLN